MTVPLLEIDQLSVAYTSAGGTAAALRGASLVARAGEVIGIVGESGCGKSTLASAIINLLPGSRLITALARVDLPQPLSPTMPITSPARATRLAPRNASTVPPALV